MCTAVENENIIEVINTDYEIKRTNLVLGTYCILSIVWLVHENYTFIALKINLSVYQPVCLMFIKMA